MTLFFRFVPSTAEYDQNADRWVIAKERFSVKATVKGFDVYRDERQTIVQRVTQVGA
jgi:hypothetical protein